MIKIIIEMGRSFAMDKCQLSSNTNTYLHCFTEILNRMMEEMTTAPQSDSISGNFIVQMIPHHRAAIEMSENLLRYTTNLPLECIANNIVITQQKGVREMEAMCYACQDQCSTTPELTSYEQQNQQILANMFQEMRSACTSNNIDANFIRQMIPHHRGAVFMAENALRFPLCPELVPVLHGIITSQKKGIRMMRQLLLRMKC